MVDRPVPAGPPPAVLVDTRDGVATVTLNNPQRRNAVTWQLVVELISALEVLWADPDARVVVLTGAGRDFCVGADLARVSSERTSDQETRTLRGRSVEDDEVRLRHASRAVELLLSFPKPTIAKVNGACAGAGLSLALAADISVAADRTMVNTAFVGAGVSGDLGSAWLLVQAVGAARARALLLDPVKMTATEAAGLGIFTEVSADLDARVAALARKLAGQSSLAMRQAKQNVLDAVHRDLAAYLGNEIPRMVGSARSEQARRAAQSFVDGNARARGGGRQ